LNDPKVQGLEVKKVVLDLYRMNNWRRGLSVSARPKICMAAVPSIKTYERFGWVILFVFWALHLVLSARDFFPRLQDLCLACAPGAQTPILAVTGMAWSQLVSSNPKFASFLASTLVDDGISGVGLAVFGMIVSLTGYRKGEKWAWYVSWSMPIGILAAQLNVYALTGSGMVIYLAAAFTIVSLLALFLPYRQFFPRKPAG
jgi:hypothetical protein